MFPSLLLHQTEDIQEDVFLFTSPERNTNSDNSYCPAAWITVNAVTVCVSTVIVSYVTGWIFILIKAVVAAATANYL